MGYAEHPVSQRLILNFIVVFHHKFTICGMFSLSKNISISFSLADTLKYAI
jgi:hypothetical protein